MEDILMLGIGGHAHSVVDSIEQNGIYNIIGFLDKEERQGEHFRDYQVIDTDAALGKYYDNGIRNAFITIGYMGKHTIREKLYCQLKEIGYTLPNVIDNSAIIASDVSLEDGVFVGKRAIINANTYIGKMCIINTGAIIEHDCKVEAFSHISVGSILCGGVHVGREAFVGANAVVIQGKSVDDQCIVGAGEIVVKSINDKCTVINSNISRVLRGGVN